MLLSMHIPKTAGTAFRLFIEANARDRAAFAYVTGADEARRDGRWSPADHPDVGAARDAVRRGAVAIAHGHEVWRLLEDTPGAPVIAWLREPLARLASEYVHLERTPEARHRLAPEVAAGRLSFAEFASRRGDLYTRTFARLTADGRPAAFFLMERASDAQRVFANVLGWRGAAPARNVTPRADAERARALAVAHRDLLDGPLKNDAALVAHWRAAWARPDSDPQSGYAQTTALVAHGPHRRTTPAAAALGIRRQLGVWREQLERRWARLGP